jgi:hypothetical protein
VVRYIAGLGNADVLIVCLGRFGVRGGRDATAKTQETLCGIGSSHQCSGARGRLLRLVGAILSITRVRTAFDLVWHHGGAKERSQNILTLVRRLQGMADESVLDEIQDNTKEAGQRLRASLNLLRSQGKLDDANYRELTTRLSTALAMVEASYLEARRRREL